MATFSSALAHTLSCVGILKDKQLKVLKHLYDGSNVFMCYLLATTDCSEDGEIHCLKKGRGQPGEEAASIIKSQTEHFLNPESSSAEIGDLFDLTLALC